MRLQKGMQDLYLGQVSACIGATIEPTILFPNKQKASSLTQFLSTFFENMPIHEEAEYFTVDNKTIVDSLIRQVDRKIITTGIYQRPYGGFAQAKEEDGSTVCSRDIFRQVLFDMEKCSVGPSDLPECKGFMMKAKESAANDIIPFGILNVEYQRTKATVISEFVQAMKDGAFQQSFGKTSPSKDMIESASVFAAAPLWESTGTGEAVVFDIGGSWNVTNTKEQLKKIEINFDDEQGWRTILPAMCVTVSYPTTGNKCIQLRAHYANKTLSSHSTFEVRKLHTDSPSSSFEVKPVYYGNTKVTGMAHVWYGKGHTSITKPLVCVGGFDPQNTLTHIDVYGQFDQLNLLKDAREKGSYDVVILHYGDAGTYIQANGQLVENLLSVLHDMSSDPAVVIAGSMGGLVARYALARMEHYGEKHGVDRFVTIDTPHQGANIPMCVQYFLDYFAARGNARAAEIRDEVLNSVAARQMLVYHYVPNWHHQSRPIPDPLRAVLLEEFKSIGMYPTKLKKYALANGAGNGTNQGFNSSTDLMNWDGTEVWASPLAAVPKPGEHKQVFEAYQCGHTKWWAIVRDSLPYDSAPGGHGNFIEQVADAAKGTHRGNVRVHHKSTCFIPTISAVDKQGANLEDKLEGTKGTPFDGVFYPDKNENHVHISSGAAQWLHGILKI